VKLPNSYDLTFSGDFQVRFDWLTTLMGEGCPSTRVGGRRSSVEWSRSDETCADIVEGLRPHQGLGCKGCSTEGPACEMLEGRQLLNAAWTPPQGFAGWDGAAGKGADPAAHVHPLDATGLRGAGHNFKLTGAPGGAGHLFAFLGGPNGVAPSGFAGMSFKAPSAQLQTDFQTLQSDEKALQAEIPASLTAAVKADQAVIQKVYRCQHWSVAGPIDIIGDDRD
jgi:hypothetical protein